MRCALRGAATTNARWWRAGGRATPLKRTLVPRSDRPKMGPDMWPGNDQYDDLGGGLYSFCKAASMSPPSGSTGSMYKRLLLGEQRRQPPGVVRCRRIPELLEHARHDRTIARLGGLGLTKERTLMPRCVRGSGDERTQAVTCGTMLLVTQPDDDASGEDLRPSPGAH